MRKVLYLTDRAKNRLRVAALSAACWRLECVSSLAAALDRLAGEGWDFALSDLFLPGTDPFELLPRLLASPSHTPVFILSRYHSWSFMRFAYSCGASGYYNLDDSLVGMCGRIESVLKAAGRGAASSGGDGLAARLLGDSPAMALLRQSIVALRERTEPVLVCGETGTGKDIVASLVHENSPAQGGPFLAENVSCIAPSLAESLLFGSVRGGFTGAGDRPGLFESAAGGTLFLDEIGELDPLLQPKLLRVLEDRRVSRLGTHARKPVQFRLICATNRDLGVAVAEGAFRADLYYRVDVLRLDVPPLRSRLEDIPTLAAHCLKAYRKTLSDRSLERLQSHSWPGNVRELFHCLVRAACFSTGEVIQPDRIRFSDRPFA